jgi:hypothetical protein
MSAEEIRKFINLLNESVSNGLDPIAEAIVHEIISMYSGRMPDTESTEEDDANRQAIRDEYFELDRLNYDDLYWRIIPKWMEHGSDGRLETIKSWPNVQRLLKSNFKYAKENVDLAKLGEEPQILTANSVKMLKDWRNHYYGFLTDKVIKMLEADDYDIN